MGNRFGAGNIPQHRSNNCSNLFVNAICKIRVNNIFMIRLQNCRTTHIHNFGFKVLPQHSHSEWCFKLVLQFVSSSCPNIFEKCNCIGIGFYSTQNDETQENQKCEYTYQQQQQQQQQQQTKTKNTTLWK